ncbi:hypothetical protein So717_03360 [Roseobacter cerasinus]|uniref:Uncharacterized protein n=2 Tax=Roseobacter cerasinus TaxID=2602289 RepID=A0A640VJS6_9RHOB|nr:hypothetical protein So717_03360 [Roseobacter cerasinus]
MNEGRLNDYEQFSRCAGLYRFHSWLTSGEAARLQPELMNVTVVNAQASQHAQTLAAHELVDTDAQKKDIELANRTADRNTDAYFHSYLVFVGVHAAAREKAGKTVVAPAILEQDAKTCRNVLSKGTKKRAS